MTKYVIYSWYNVLKAVRGQYGTDRQQGKTFGWRLKKGNQKRGKD